jgi:hypothetical protein
MQLAAKAEAVMAAAVRRARRTRVTTTTTTRVVTRRTRRKKRRRRRKRRPMLVTYGEQSAEATMTTRKTIRTRPRAGPRPATTAQTTPKMNGATKPEMQVLQAEALMQATFGAELLPRALLQTPTGTATRTRPTTPAVALTLPPPPGLLLLNPPLSKQPPPKHPQKHPPTSPHPPTPPKLAHKSTKSSPTRTSPPMTCVLLRAYCSRIAVWCGIGLVGASRTRRGGRCIRMCLRRRLRGVWRGRGVRRVRGGGRLRVLE